MRVYRVLYVCTHCNNNITSFVFISMFDNVDMHARVPCTLRLHTAQAIIRAREYNNIMASLSA